VLQGVLGVKTARESPDETLSRLLSFFLGTTNRLQSIALAAEVIAVNFAGAAFGRVTGERSTAGTEEEFPQRKALTVALGRGRLFPRSIESGLDVPEYLGRDQADMEPLRHTILGSDLADVNRIPKHIHECIELRR
jgi:hypothetical protein